MKLTKRQADLVTWLYNEHLESCLISNFNKINASLKLAEDYPDLFSCEKYGFNGARWTYNFTVKRLGMIPEFLKPDYLKQFQIKG